MTIISFDIIQWYPMYPNLYRQIANKLSVIYTQFNNTPEGYSFVCHATYSF